MAESTVFRCYYEDGSIITSDICPEFNQQGSPLIDSEYTIIEDVVANYYYPWLFVILFGILVLSKKGN